MDVRLEILRAPAAGRLVALAVRLSTKCLRLILWEQKEGRIDLDFPNAPWDGNIYLHTFPLPSNFPFNVAMFQRM